MPCTKAQLRFANMIVFNGYWYALMLVAAGVLPHGICGGLALYAVIHFIMTPYGAKERALIACHFVTGLGLEAAWHHFELFRYTQGFLPLWMVFMWLNFSLSICHTWWPWVRPLWAGALVGLAAAIGPYFAASKAGLVDLDLHKHVWVILSWLVYGVLVSWSANWVMNPFSQK